MMHEIKESFPFRIKKIINLNLCIQKWWFTKIHLLYINFIVLFPLQTEEKVGKGTEQKVALCDSSYKIWNELGQNLEYTPQEEYVSPKPVYVPPKSKEDYGPPKQPSTYEPPKAPKNDYVTPAGDYGPPKPSYSPPKPGMDFLNYRLFKDKKLIINNKT